MISDLEFTVEQAFSTLKGENVHLACCLGTDSTGRKALLYYQPDRTSQTGYLGYAGEEKPLRLVRAETAIIGGLMPRIDKGKRIIVRRLPGRQLLVPVINFEEEDGVVSPRGRELVTVASGNRWRDKIYNLPILGLGKVSQDTDSSAMAGIGYLRRGNNYLQVVVIGAKDLISGGYVNEATILSGSQRITARKTA